MSWVGDEQFDLDGISFHLHEDVLFLPLSTTDRFSLLKRRDMIEWYLDLIAEQQPKHILELGIYRGGSCAFMAMAAEPDLLIALELDPEPVQALQTLIETRDLQDRIHAFYGIDQGDTAAVRAAIEPLMPDGGFDLIVDDASHLLDPTRASFNTLFPLVRPGGIYVIEDWSWAHVGWGLTHPDESPLTELIFEITLALPSWTGAISQVHLRPGWAMIVRGEGEVNPNDFDISQCYADRGRALLASQMPLGPTDT